MYIFYNRINLNTVVLDSNCFTIIGNSPSINVFNAIIDIDNNHILYNHLINDTISIWIFTSVDESIDGDFYHVTNNSNLSDGSMNRFVLNCSINRLRNYMDYKNIIKQHRENTLNKLLNNV